VHDNEAEIGSRLAVAVFQEVGTSTVPPRPFLGLAAFENRDAVLQILGHA